MPSALFLLGDFLRPSDLKAHTVDGVEMRVDLLHPDVYGCAVSITPGRVEVNVGSECVDIIMQTEEKRRRLLQDCSAWPYRYSMQFRSSGHIAVTTM